MPQSRFDAAQQGIVLAMALPHRNPLAEAAAPAARAMPASAARARGTPAPAAGRTGGVLPAPAKLSRAERLRILDGFETVIGSVYAHLPLKRARYGFDPVQRLCILRSEVASFDDHAFHAELAAIVTQMRDYHTRYTWSAAYAGKVAMLPFLVEMYGPDDAPTYVVTKVGKGLAASFVPGVVLEHWNGVPIDLAVLRHADEECAGRPDGMRSASLQSLTFRALEFGPPPDEEWVVVGYRSTDAAGRPAGAQREVRVPWRVVDPGQVSGLLSAGPGATRRARDSAAARKLRLARAVNPAAAAVRQAKMLLFAPQALVGEMPPPARAQREARRRGLPSGPKATSIDTRLPDTLKAQSLQTDGGPVGYLRIWGFDTEPDAFIAELQRLIPLLPQQGLVIDVRGNPGGYILAAERALQLFTPRLIEPVRFSVLATPVTRALAASGGHDGELAAWRDSLEAAVRNGETYAQPLPLTDPADCNAIGQRYGGPVVLVADTNTYSSGDIFSAGFVDNGLGPFVCVGRATGAGGANVWDYTDLRDALDGTPAALPRLPGGVALSFAFRRITRAGPSAGLTVEDVGVSGAPYAMTRDDLLAGNVDLLRHCVELLRKQPLSTLAASVDKSRRKLMLRSEGLDRIDIFVDGHPAGSHAVKSGGTLDVGLPVGCRGVEVAGYLRERLLQRRRVACKG